VIIEFVDNDILQMILTRGRWFIFDDICDQYLISFEYNLCLHKKTDGPFIKDLSNISWEQASDIYKNKPCVRCDTEHDMLKYELCEECYHWYRTSQCEMHIRVFKEDGSAMKICVYDTDNMLITVNGFSNSYTIRQIRYDDWLIRSCYDLIFPKLSMYNAHIIWLIRDLLVNDILLELVRIIIRPCSDETITYLNRIIWT
jgi:hypothetical protein